MPVMTITHLFKDYDLPNRNSSDDGNINNITPPFKDKIPLMRITEEAERLSAKFNNPNWVGFYAKGILWLGIDRVNLIEARVSDSSYAAKLFTKILKQEIDTAMKQGGKYRPRSDNGKR